MKRFVTMKLAPALCMAFLLGSATQAFDLQNMSAEERTQLGEEIRAYLLENPEVIFEAAEIYRAREAELAAAAAQIALQDLKPVLLDDGISYVGGNPEGDVTIVEFVDYRCGYCRKAHEELVQLLEADGNIRWVVKEFPILSEASEISARTAMATLNAFGPEKYGLVHDILMKFNGPMNVAAIESIAKDIDVDAEILMASMEDPSITEYLQSVREQAQALDINGTPAFIIGDDVARGYIGPENMIDAVAAARAMQ